MKRLNNFLNEALIKKNTELNIHPIKIDIDEKTEFTKEEIQKVKDFADTLKVSPYAITNKYFDNNIKPSKINLYLVYTKNYLTKNHLKNSKYTYNNIIFSKFLSDQITRVYIVQEKNDMSNYITVKSDNTLEDLFNKTLDKLKQIDFFFFRRQLDY